MATFRTIAPIVTLVVSTCVTRVSADEAAVANAGRGAESASSSLTFERDVQPLLTKFGCNSGPCHGKSGGQNGFALSLLGFDVDFDHDALIHAGRGRRVSPAAPEQSLLLQKATAVIPHGGGARFAQNSEVYRLLRDWIQVGAPRTPADAPRLVRVRVEPASRSLQPQGQQQLRVFAEYTDGSQRDVTDATTFQSNDATA